MDRTSRIGLIVCFVLLVGIQFTLDRMYPTPPAIPRSAVAATGTPTATATNPTENAPSLTATPSAPGQPPAVAPPVEEKINTLENDAIKVTFTSVGAAIKTVELKLHKADNGGNIILNEQSRSNVLALSRWPGADTANFTAQPDLANAITYSTTLPNGVTWQRHYAFGKASDHDGGIGGFFRVLFHKLARHLGQRETKPEVYTLEIADTLTNPGTADVTLPDFDLSVGRAQPLFEAPSATGERVPNAMNAQYVGSGWLTSSYHLTTLNDFNPSSFLFVIPTRGPRDAFDTTGIDSGHLAWLGVENQFFALLLTPGTEKGITEANFHCYNLRRPDGYIATSGVVPDIEASATFPAVTIPAGKSVTLNYSLYAGPKDYDRLDALGQNQGALMNYDGILPFSFLIVPMLTVLRFWYLIFNNYGVAIILLTLMIKAVTWPLQSYANRTGKRMQALGPMLKELQAKYKEEPEKLQKETFALYRDYEVNPFSGCVPALIQMPVFFSLYFMLQNAVELRGQQFLWVHDLTKPDAVWTAPFYFLGFHPSLHPLPIMVTALTMVMMRLTPNTAVDPQQQKIMQFMPLVFLFIFYNFAAALSLYYVINNAVSIVQIYRNLKKPIPVLKRKAPSAKPAAAKKK
jgi:YidC/Oxa1 family membrane protein insertase